LVEGGEEQDVERRVPRTDVVDVPEQVHAVGDSELTRERFDLRSKLAVACEHERAPVDGRAHANEREGLLDLGQAAGPADDQRVVGGAEVVALRAARLIVGADPCVEVEAVRDDRDLLHGRDAQPHEVVALLVAHRDDAVGDMRERPFDAAVDALACRAEVAAQHVTVERVHEGLRAAPARYPRGDAAGGAGFRRVRVQHVRLTCAQEAAKVADGGEVGPRRRVAPEAVEVQVRHAELAGEMLHRRLTGRNAAGDDEHVVSAPLLAGGEFEHGQRGAAYVEPCDCVDDPHRTKSRPRPSASAKPITSQNSAVSGVPPNSASPAIAPRIDTNQATASGEPRAARTAARATPASRTRKTTEPTRPSSAGTWSKVCCGMRGLADDGKYRVGWSLNRRFAAGR